MKRLFFALWPSKDCRKQLDRFNQSINSEELKKVKSDNLHVTLVYLGNVDAQTEALIRQEVEHIKAKPFVLQFEQLAFWKKPRILCLLTQQYDPQILLLVNALKSIVQQYGIKVENRPYKPHITLARKARKPLEINVQAIEWPADSFCLVESVSTPEGVHYQVLQSWHF